MTRQMINKFLFALGFLSAHIMQIFQRRGSLINEDMIRGYLSKHIQTLWGVRKKVDGNVKRIQKKRFKIESE